MSAASVPLPNNNAVNQRSRVLKHQHICSICLVDTLSCQYLKFIIHVNHKKPKLVTDDPNIHHLDVKIY